MLKEPTSRSEQTYETEEQSRVSRCENRLGGQMSTLWKDVPARSVDNPRFLFSFATFWDSAEVGEVQLVLIDEP